MAAAFGFPTLGSSPGPSQRTDRGGLHFLGGTMEEIIHHVSMETLEDLARGLAKRTPSGWEIPEPLATYIQKMMETARS